MVHIIRINKINQIKSNKQLIQKGQNLKMYKIAVQGFKYCLLKGID